jgi:uncharacterized membrane protein
VLTAAGTVLAVRRSAPFLAWLGFAGAFFAPWLLGSDVDALEGLTTWLAVVDFGIAAALCFRAWSGLDTFGVVATVGYFVAWRTQYFEDARTGAAGMCLRHSFFLELVCCWRHYSKAQQVHRSKF